MLAGGYAEALADTNATNLLSPYRLGKAPTGDAVPVLHEPWKAPVLASKTSMKYGVLVMSSLDVAVTIASLVADAGPDDESCHPPAVQVSHCGSDVLCVHVGGKAVA